jgi:hypothetical protein
VRVAAGGFTLAFGGVGGRLMMAKKEITSKEIKDKKITVFFTDIMTREGR